MESVEAIKLLVFTFSTGLFFFTCIKTINNFILSKTIQKENKVNKIPISPLIEKITNEYYFENKFDKSFSNVRQATSNDYETFGESATVELKCLTKDSNVKKLIKEIQKTIVLFSEEDLKYASKNKSSNIVTDENMGLKFISNLSFMFRENPSLIERYQLAQKAGFKAVESGFPVGFSLEEIVNAKNEANIEQILINVYPGDVLKGELGFAAIPGQEDSFKQSIELTIEYAKALHCKFIHIMSGKVINPTVNNDQVYENNLLYAVDKLKEEGLIGVIEPINNLTVPDYYMNNFSKGLNVVKKIDSPHLKLQLDVFHLQHCCGNLTYNIEQLLPFVAHIQVAQVPHRNEPDTDGEIDYKYIFSLLENKGYQGYIGLEYIPKGDTIDGLSWIEKFGFSL